jgi:hypothetical protein
MRSATATASKLVIYGAIAANVAIAATKLVVASMTGSAAMRSEGIRSSVGIRPQTTPAITVSDHQAAVHRVRFASPASALVQTGRDPKAAHCNAHARTRWASAGTVKGRARPCERHLD